MISRAEVGLTLAGVQSPARHRATLTIFCVPKPFVGHIGIIQRNALQSWIRLQPTPELIVLGDETGAAEEAAAAGARHVPAIRCNEHGTPLLSDVFMQGEALARGDTLAYVNADIVLMSDFAGAVARLKGRTRDFLMVGRRCDLDLAEPIDFERDWEAPLRALARASGRVQGVEWIDYFVFRRGLWPSMPAFALGRTAWDNWLLLEARRREADLIDASEVVTAIHQNHHYAGFATPAQVWTSEEAERNRELAGGPGGFMSIRSANWRMNASAVSRHWRNYPIRVYDALLRFYLRAKYRYTRRRRSPR